MAARPSMSSRAASSTLLNMAVRIIAVKARSLPVTGRGGGGGAPWAAASTAAATFSGSVSASHSSSSDESVWRTVSPSHSTRSSNCSLRCSSGTVCLSAR